eukprot:gnl/TRDRNA2_/TRDRNA2_36088_c0_seq1.p1 gnl/TRDRNA2_/TRDRNA2_36088_c0~~gnl/TRDRNA2_/TRDRNA2_36088_c0_seq1.p1  ORF type:complete len:656 (+),score=66.70 gnl/TRDRNA2_/TRDRNA2_36088_c0_seq1:165-1970(+)
MGLLRVHVDVTRGAPLQPNAVSLLQPTASVGLSQRTASQLLFASIRPHKVNGIGIQFSCVCVLAVVAVAGIMQLLTTRVSSRKGDFGLKEKRTELANEAKDGQVTEDDDLDRDNFAVIFVAIGGSIMLFMVATKVWLHTKQLAPLATSGIALSLLFTLRPLKIARAGQNITVGMAAGPWFCIVWQWWCGALTSADVKLGIFAEPHSQVVPWQMLVTFIGAVYLCKSLELTGGLAWYANKVATSNGRGRSSLFFLFAVVAGIMTTLVPDDVVTMTLAPTICTICRLLDIEAEPYIWSIFYCSNIFAVILVTGNITNTVVAQILGTRFLAFAEIMAVPGFLAGFAAVALLYIEFHHVFQNKASEQLDPVVTVSDPGMRIYPIRGIICLTRFLFVFTFAACDFLHNWPLWMTLCVFAALALVLDLVLDLLHVDGIRMYTWEVVASLPYELFFFFPALFILVLQLISAGVVDLAAQGFAHVTDRPAAAMVAVAFVSMGLAQALSTAPMTILLAHVVTRVPGWQSPAPGTYAHDARKLALYALVISSNFCGNVTRMGTMGGQMLFQICRAHGVMLSDTKMALRGVVIMLPVTALALVALWFMSTRI